MLGQPNHVTTFSNKNIATVSEVQSRIGVVSAHIVKYFIAMIMYLAPDIPAFGLIGPTNYMAHLSNTCKVTFGFKGISSLLDGYPAL
jgi:hypothetical protein